MENMATVHRDSDGNLVLVDPVACEIAKSVGKHNCAITFGANSHRILHFRERAKQLGKTASEVVIVIANVDDPHGKVLADALMPGFDWEQFRAKGEIPFARGLAGREGVLEFAKMMDPDLDCTNKTEEIQVVVVDYGTCRIFF